MTSWDLSANPATFWGLRVSYLRRRKATASSSLIRAHMASQWLTVGPEALYWGPRNVNKLWGEDEIYITENGCSSSDIPAADGKVYDTDRVMYLRNYLSHLQRATEDGVPVKGYFLWSLMDNFEWADGYTNRFGLHYVDYQTQKRTPKLSADFYKEVIKENRVV